MRKLSYVQMPSYMKIRYETSCNVDRYDRYDVICCCLDIILVKYLCVNITIATV